MVDSPSADVSVEVVTRGFIMEDRTASTIIMSGQTWTSSSYDSEVETSSPMDMTPGHKTGGDRDLISYVITGTASHNVTNYVDSYQSTGVMQTSTTYIFAPEDEFTGLHAISDVEVSPGHSFNLTSLVLVVIIALTVIGNLLVCLAVKMDARLHQITYYFLASMATLHMILAMVLMAPTILVILTGFFNYSDDVCKLWITLDFFFCNCTCLHLAFVNMNRFLHLKDPGPLGQIHTTCSLSLWLGAPWTISLVQSIAQFMLSQGDQGILFAGICFISDKNFILLGVMFSFLIPTVISLTFYGLCEQELRVLRAGKFVDGGEHDLNDQFGSTETIIAESDVESSVCSSHDEEMETQQQEEMQLSTVTTIQQSHLSGYEQQSRLTSYEQQSRLTGYEQTPQNIQTNQETTSFCDDSLHIQPHTENIHDTGNANIVYNANNTQGFSEQSSCTLLLVDAAMNNSDRKLDGYREHYSHEHYNLAEMLHKERVVSRIMCVLVLLCVTLWLPYSSSNIVYAVCEHCVLNMSFVEMITFRWLAYCMALVQPYVYIVVSQPLRRAVWHVLTCHTCRQTE